ncbi:MAG: N-6 DNA methylase [Paludibacteraceae bacterium]|nr:N-6 DNA methylase [Paludibacteraceae bacterium]
MEISSQRIETFDRIAESFSWALSHSRVSVESLGEFATLLYLIKHDQLRKVSNSDCKEGNDLFVLQFGPSMVAGDMEKWMQNNIRAIGLMRKEADPNQEIEAILQRYRTTLRQHQSQDALIRTFDLIKEAELKEEEYIPLLSHIEQRIAIHDNFEVAIPVYPQSLSKLLSSLVHDKHKAVYDPYIGTASLLMDLPANVEIYGNEINPEIYQYAVLKLALSGRMYHCQYAPVKVDDIKDSHVSCIISFPPMVRDIKDERYIFESQLRLFQEDKNITEIILVVPDNFLTSRRYQDIRKSLTDANLLEHVLKLPVSFLNGTIIAPSIIHLRKERVDDYAVFYNLAEDAEKEGKRMEISIEMWQTIVKNDYDELIYGSLRHTYHELADNNYDWSCDSYPLNDCVTGIPYGGETKPFKDFMVRFHGEPLKTWPETYLSFRKLNSPLDTPIKMVSRGTETTGYVRVTEPVIVIGYSNKCPLFYLDASEEEPAYLNRREVLYRCIDPLVNPMYLVCAFSKSINRVIAAGFGEYIYADTMDPVHRIEKFMRAQKVGLPSLPVQISRVEEWKENYFHEQLQNSNMAEYVDALKQQYIEEVRSRKHNMRPFLREIKSSVDLARLYLDKASSIEDLKAKLSSLLDSIQSNGEGLASIVERLSQEDKFEEPEYLDVEKAIEDCAEYYRKNTSLSISVIKLMEEPIAAPADSEHCETWGKYALISAYDFRRMLNAIIENARVHGFEGHDEGHHIEITIDFDWDKFKISVWNDGLPFPEGFDINTYGQRGGKAGKHAGTGDGGHQVVAIADHFGGWVELNSSGPGNPQNYAEVIVYLHIADKDFDESLYEGLDDILDKEDDNV